ncbi:hypothetical protein BH11ACT4_BH11ACT4_23460 [soil metagenome]
MKRTKAVTKVAVEIMSSPSRQFWGYPLSIDTGLRSGVLYPILQRMLDEGWLADGWETIDRTVEKRPARRYYTLTDLGARELGAIAAAAPSDQRATTAKLGLA